MTAPRNKTIRLNEQQRCEYLAQCRTLTSLSHSEELIDTYIHQDALTALPYIPASFADLIIADPPYNLTKDYNGRLFRKRRTEDYAAFLHSWMPQLMRILKPEGSIYICCDWASSPIVYDVLKDYAIIRNRISWQREKGRGSLRNWKNCVEDIWYATKSDVYYFNPSAVKHRRAVVAPYREGGTPKDWKETESGRFRDTYASNFWDDISIPFWSMPENTEHPTQKPEKLIAKLILASSREGDMVFDPFAGSGSTAVTARKLGRRFCSIEIDSYYCALAQYRIEHAAENKRIQGYADGVFWPRNIHKPVNKQ